MTALDRRVLLTNWVRTAMAIVEKRAGYKVRLFEKTGNLTTAGVTGDKRISMGG